MNIPFYKMQIAGNGFVLIDLAALDAKGKPESATRKDKAAATLDTAIDPSSYPALARLLCDRRYGIGSSGVIFLSPDNAIRVLGPKGRLAETADDAILCAARFAFDSGRAAARTIVFRTNRGDRSVDILGAHEFRIALGSPFSILGGAVITPETKNVVESLEISGTNLSCSAIHVREDVVTAFPRALGTLDFPGFSSLARRAFPSRDVIPSVAQAVTRETILVRALARQESGASAVACAALATAVCSGQTETDAIVIFESAGTDGNPDEEIGRDQDNSRRLAASWDVQANEMYVTGSGGYLFEGSFDAPDMPGAD